MFTIYFFYLLNIEILNNKGANSFVFKGSKLLQNQDNELTEYLFQTL